MTVNNHKRLMSLDFIGECGDMLVTAGAAITAAASVGRYDVLHLAFRQANSVVADGLAELNSIASSDGGIANE